MSGVYLDRVGVWVHPLPDGLACIRCGAPATLAVSEVATGPLEGSWCRLRCWGAYHDERTTLRGTLRRPADPARPPDWSARAARYPASGEPGISETKTSGGTGADVLLLRMADGALAGILWYQHGRISVLVDPARRRQGVGRALVRAAGRRWSINLAAQAVTHGGAALARAAMPPSEENDTT